MAANQAMIGGTITGTAAALGTVAGLEGCTSLAVQITALTAETIGISLSMDGVTYSSAIKPIDATTGAPAAAATLGVGYYWITGVPLAFVKFTKSAGANTGTLKYFAI